VALARWLGPVDTPASSDGGDCREQLLTSGHSTGITTFCLWFDVPFSWQSFTAIVQVLTSLRGPDLLRVKGLVHMREEAGPVVVQGAQHLFHEPVTLESWPDDDRRSRIVFITRGLERDTVESLFSAICAVADRAAPSGGPSGPPPPGSTACV
jgi:G3E family GTPase